MRRRVGPQRVKSRGGEAVRELEWLGAGVTKSECMPVGPRLRAGEKECVVRFCRREALNARHKFASRVTKEACLPSNESGQEANQSKCMKEHVLLCTTKASPFQIYRSMLAKLGWELIDGLEKVPSTIGQQRQ